MISRQRILNDPASGGGGGGGGPVSGSYVITFCVVVVVLFAIVVFYIVRFGGGSGGTTTIKYPPTLELTFRDDATMSLFLRSLNDDYPTSPVYVPLIYIDQLYRDEGDDIRKLVVPIYRSSSLSTTNNTSVVVVLDYVASQTVCIEHNQELVFDYRNGNFSQSSDSIPLPSFVQVDATGVSVFAPDKQLVRVQFPVHLDYTNRNAEMCATLQSYAPLSVRTVFTLLPFSVPPTPENIIELATDDSKLASVDNRIVNIPDRRYKYDSYGVCKNTPTGVDTFRVVRCDDTSDHKSKVYAGAGRCLPLDDASYTCLSMYNKLVTYVNGRETVDQLKISVTDPSRYATCRIGSESLPLYDPKSLNQCSDPKAPLFDVATQQCVSDLAVESLCRTMYKTNGNYVLPPIATAYDSSRTYLNCQDGVALFVHCTDIVPLRPRARNMCIDTRCKSGKGGGDDMYTFVVEEKMMSDKTDKRKTEWPRFLTDYVAAVRYCVDGAYIDTEAAESQTTNNNNFRKCTEAVFKSLGSTKITNKFKTLTHIEYSLPLYVIEKGKVISDNVIRNKMLRTFRDVPLVYIHSENHFIRVVTHKSAIGQSRGFIYFSLYIDVLDNRLLAENDDLIIDIKDGTPRILCTNDERVCSTLLEKYTHVYACSWIIKNRLWVYNPKERKFDLVEHNGYPILKHPFGFISAALTMYFENDTTPRSDQSKIRDTFAIVVKTQSAQNTFKHSKDAPLYDNYGYMIDDVVVKYKNKLSREPKDLSCQIEGARLILGSTFYKTRDGRALCDKDGVVIDDPAEIAANYPCSVLKLVRHYGPYIWIGHAPFVTSSKRNFGVAFLRLTTTRAISIGILESSG
ncbi:hypothetical protein WDU94_012451 [Cyamophila willieti]